MMKFTAKQIATYLKGEVVGDPAVEVGDFSKIEQGKPGTLTFLSNMKYLHFIYSTKASVVLVNKDFEPEQEVNTTLIKVEDAYQALSSLMLLVQQAKPRKEGVAPTAVVSEGSSYGEGVYLGHNAFIGENVEIGENVQIYPLAYIGDNVVIKDDVTIYPNVTVYEGCEIGNRCIIHAGAVIGADGFGFAPSEDGYSKIPQIGKVVLQDDVEIGANTTIDRSTIGVTLIKKGVKLDNLIQVAHNAEIGENTVMAAQCGVAGSTKIGKWCMVGGQVGFAGHISIGDHCNFGAQTGVSNTVPANKTFMGSPGFEARSYARSSAVYKRLPEIYRTVNKLEKEIENLKKNVE